MGKPIAAAALIIAMLVVISFSAFAYTQSGQSQIAQSFLTTQTAVTTESAAGCGVAGQAATTESANGGLGCGPFLTTQTAVSTEIAGGCGAGQAVTTENANGSLGCATFLTTQTAVSTEAVASCPSGQFAQNETGAGAFQCKAPSGGITFFRQTNPVTTNTTAPTIVQNTFATATSGTSFSKAFASNIGAIHMIFVCEGQSTVTTALGAPTDTLGLSYFPTTLTTAASSAEIECWSAMSISGGADTVTTGTYGSTCSAANLCTLFIFEINGADFAQLATTGNFCQFSATVATTTPACGNTFAGAAAQSVLFIAVEQKLTAGTDTAGTSFSLANGETGSLKYLTEKATITGPSTTCPATYGTSSAYAAQCIALGSYAPEFKIPLSANTQYNFQMYMSGMSTRVQANGMAYIRQFNASGVTAVQFCTIVGDAAFGLCASGPDNSTSLAFKKNAVNPAALLYYGTLKTGANPVLMVLCTTDVTFTLAAAVTVQANGYGMLEAG